MTITTTKVKCPSCGQDFTKTVRLLPKSMYHPVTGTNSIFVKGSCPHCHISYVMRYAALDNGLVDIISGPEVAPVPVTKIDLEKEVSKSYYDSTEEPSVQFNISPTGFDEVLVSLETLISLELDTDTEQTLYNNTYEEVIEGMEKACDRTFIGIPYYNEEGDLLFEKTLALEDCTPDEFVRAIIRLCPTIDRIQLIKGLDTAEDIAKTMTAIYVKALVSTHFRPIPWASSGKDKW